MDLTQYILLTGNNITIDGVQCGASADVSKMCGEFDVKGNVISKYNHTLDSAIDIVKQLDEAETNTDALVIESLESEYLLETGEVLV